MGRPCCAAAKRMITIKALDKTDGVTTWEYGPGLLWRHHYGADAITGVEPTPSATLDKYAICANVGGLVLEIGNRNSGTLQANCVEALYLTKLNSLDGTVTSKTLVDGLLCQSITALSVFPLNFTLSDAVALSGGDYAILQRRWPTIELDDFTSNTANKTYILHAHGQQAGTIILKTRTSDETITLNWDDSAADVEAAFEATSDCTAATATGGPWPHAKIEIDVTWSAASGDVKSIQRDTTYNTGLANRNVDSSVVVYSPATGLITSSAGYIFGNYSSRLITDSGIMPSPVESLFPPIKITAGPSNTVGVLVNGGTLQSVESWTPGSPWSNNWQKQDNRTRADLASQVENGEWILTAGRKSYGGPTRNVTAVTVDMSSGAVTEYDNAKCSTLITPQNERVKPFAIAKDGDDTSLLWCSHVRVHSSGGSRAPYNNSNNQFWFDSDGEECEFGSSAYRLGGGVYGHDGTNVYGFASYADGTSNTAIVRKFWPPSAGSAVGFGSPYILWAWEFILEPGQRYETGTELRFVFSGGRASNWMDWACTEAQMQTAIHAAFGGNNTTGIQDTAEINPLGAYSGDLVNSTVSLLEQGVQIVFLGSPSANGDNVPANNNFQQGVIQIETRTETPPTGYTEAGVIAWSLTDASVVWNRRFGDALVSGAPVSFPSYGWLRGDYVYVAGSLVENEL